MSSLNSKLQLALLNRKKGRNLLEKGFTLVELMIVIVIVGILSAVALPNFLSQTSKAKATEAKSQISAMIKNASADYQQLGIVTPETDCSGIGGPAAYKEEGGVNVGGEQLFDYTCGITGEALTVTATANANDPSIEGGLVVFNANLKTGKVGMNNDQSSLMFGGKLANPA
ncbi:type IV pilin PilA [Synechococcus sp. PROS-U-1]|nr:type IV pilin PilA [Synechococcus sp. PROS-U-1]